MIPKVLVLGRIENLEQGRRGITPVVGSHLVDFVEHEDRVFCLGLAKPRDDPARHRPHVGAPVAADLGLVPNAPQGDPDEFPAHGPGDGLPQRGLPDAGRSQKTQDRASAPLVVLLFPGQDGQLVEDPLLDLFQVVVVGIEDPPGLHKVVGLGGLPVPGKIENDVEVGADDLGLLGLPSRLHQAGDLPGDFLFRLGGEPHLLGLLTVADDLLVPLLAVPQLLLDRLHLLPEKEIALGLLDLVGNFGLDLSAQLLDFDFLHQMAGDEMELLLEGPGLENLLALGHRKAQEGGDEVAQMKGVFDVEGHRLELVGEVGGQGPELFRLGEDGAKERLGGVGLFRNLGDFGDLGPGIGRFGDFPVETDPPDSLDHDGDPSGRDPEKLVDDHESSHLIVGGRLGGHRGRRTVLEDLPGLFRRDDLRSGGLFPLPLSGDADESLGIAVHGIVDGPHGAWIVEGDRGQNVGEDHRVVQDDIGGIGGNFNGIVGHYPAPSWKLMGTVIVCLGFFPTMIRRNPEAYSARTGRPSIPSRRRKTRSKSP